MSTVSGAVGAAGAAANFTGDASGNLLITAATPSPPAAGKVAVSSISVGGRQTPSATPPVGAAYALEPSVSQGAVVEWNTIGNTTADPTAVGQAAPAKTGTSTARNVATTNVFTLARRWGLVSATSTAGSSLSIRGTTLQFCLQGGFHFVTRFGISDAAPVANARMFVGMCPIMTQFGNAEPSTQINIFGVGCEAGGTTLIAYNNDGSGTATMSASLGASFVTNTQSVDWYELAMFCAVGGSTVYYVVTRLNTGEIASGSWTSDLPAATTLLTPQLWRNNGTTALAVALDFQKLRIRTDA